MNFLLLIGDKPQSVPLQVGTFRCSLPFPGWSQCHDCTHRKSVESSALPALHVTWVQGATEPELVCLHREATIHSLAGVDKTTVLGGVDDTTPAHEGVPT